MNSTTSLNAADVARVLSGVYDPELGLDVVSLGLVYGIDVDDESIDVRMSLTSMGCPLEEVIVGSVQTALTRAFPRHVVSVDIVQDPPWRVEMADYEALVRLGLVRAPAR